MTNNVRRRCALLIAFMASMATGAAASGIGDITGTSTPEVVTPSTTPAPQTPAYPSPPVGSGAPAFPGSPYAAHQRMSAPRVVAPVKPHG
ncbi:hypothetical protein [Methylocapsa sp. S129]|uniref:hypothetical protein n=1 Tax=Methylocapsa sp. S129 TaxID=1641869 RepID=UPI00131BBDF8|nr:hypothetical protein [Methylocapsa sp. S129]